MATTFFLNDQAPVRHNANSRLDHRVRQSGVSSQNTGVAPELRARLNIAASVNFDGDRIKITVSAASVVLGATGTASALLGFPVTGIMLAVTGLFLLELSDMCID